LMASFLTLCYSSFYNHTPPEPSEAQVELALWRGSFNFNRVIQPGEQRDLGKASMDVQEGCAEGRITVPEGRKYADFILIVVFSLTFRKYRFIIMKKTILCGLGILLMLLGPEMHAQRKKDSDKESTAEKISLSAFKMRNVGPAFLSGRIADIAIHPDNDNVWYVAVGSGGVWRTENSGTTWEPLFDGEGSYSIGCITLDPSNPARIWVGTGENVGGRHVGFGDGLYLSNDGGKSWTNMGLPKSEHISKIVVHPDNSNVVWVASQGPLWSPGGERGIYKTTDGGETWRRVLGEDPWTGATELLIDPRDPEVLYAATWDRHRTVAAYMGGGPGSGLHKSTDGGETWTKLTNGLPGSNLGKTGLAMSPQDADVLYAAVETDLRKGGIYKSTDGGSSWKKMSSTVSGGTGPHYYQELYASPHKFDRLYLMDVRVQVSEDGGRTFTQLNERDKHSDNHAIAFRSDDPDYLMIGTDAGIYESFDLAQTWKYHKNLPLTQFYKVAVNNAEPFYHIFGGTQDNGSAGGPSATDDRSGISNRHWYKTLGADGHQSATDPEYDHLIYAETQRGGLNRIDLTTGEQVSIQPQSRKGEPYERFNWDAPILVSPHNPARLYFASYRVWKSENRGDDWSPISGDLTRNEERLTLPIMGRQQSFDNPWDVYAMSDYNTITSLSESPVREGVLYSGTDDGFVQVSENGGNSWREIPVTKMGLPERSFVNDIKADNFDENTVYVCLDNHKEGDFRPMIYKSTNKGKSWTSLASNLPERTLVWRLVQDHVDPKLLFVATEFGLYTSLNGGESWHKLPGTPNMAFRDLTIQKRENDLVAASFGRGFFVLDDFSALREFNESNLSKEGKLFTPRSAKWYVPRSSEGNTGTDYYFAENPEYGAVFTYHLSGDYSTSRSLRKKKEKELNKNKQDVPFPGWEALDKEKLEEAARIWLTIEDMNGNVIRHLQKKASKGSGRIAWNLRHTSSSPLDPDRNRYGSGNGPMVIPGSYKATLYLEEEGQVRLLDGPITFEVKPIREGILKGVGYDEYDAYRQELVKFEEEMTIVFDRYDRARDRYIALEEALERTPLPLSRLAGEFRKVEEEIAALDAILDGSESKGEVGENNPPSVRSRYYHATRGLRTTYGPTPLHRRSLKIAREMLTELRPRMNTIIDQLVPELEQKVKAAGGPVILGKN